MHSEGVDTSVNYSPVESITLIKLKIATGTVLIGVVKENKKSLLPRVRQHNTDLLASA